MLELKASASGAYLSSGFAQLLGYLRDRPGLFAAPASGWLVAPSSTAYTFKAPGSRSLWITSANEVGDAVKQIAETADLSTVG